MLLLLAVLAGVLTTLAGLGGGLFLVLALSAWWGDPVSALAATTPALLIGNLHRVWLYRDRVAWPIVGPFASAALPGALLGACLSAALPAAWVQGAISAAVLVVLARTWGGWRWTPPARALVPAGAAIGFAASSGGAGLLAGPYLLAYGLAGEAYIASVAVGAIAMHLGRLLGYGLGGGWTSALWLSSAWLAVGIPAGNLLGARIRAHLPPSPSLEPALAVLLLLLTLAGFR
jgi:hypothetical protein